MLRIWFLSLACILQYQGDRVFKNQDKNMQMHAWPVDFSCAAVVVFVHLVWPFGFMASVEESSLQSTLKWL